MKSPVVRKAKPAQPPDVPRHVRHPSFRLPSAEERYRFDAPVAAAATELKHMPDDVTRELARRMHYAAYRAAQARTPREASTWLGRYFAVRDRILLGNRKLAYRAVQQRAAYHPRAEDLASECQIVLIKAVALYNPWLGIRFSTYAFTCMLRALGRLCQRLAADRLARSVSLEAVGEGDCKPWRQAQDAGEDAPRVSEFLRPEHPLLSTREKNILALRFHADAARRMPTLESVGRDLGLSKERVRQVQAGALKKLRLALTECEG
jgi:RNA polymerase sigma factor (sigma-70 family)